MSTSEQAGTESARFSRRSALRSERLYGRGYQGPASEQVFASLTGCLRLWPGVRVLEIGSGLGGDAFRLADRHGAAVLGLDSAPDMTALSQERAGPRGDIRFVTGDVADTELGEACFDVVWTRDCGMYLTPERKARAWTRLQRALVPGGQVLLTDYGRDDDNHSIAFEQHAKACGHHLATTAEYTRILEDAGFVDVRAEDRTSTLLESMVSELDRLRAERTSFLRDYDVTEYDELVDRWRSKIAFAAGHGLVWIVLTATAPTDRP